jgi:hypothetical protein
MYNYDRVHHTSDFTPSKGYTLNVPMLYAQCGSNGNEEAFS